MDIQMGLNGYYVLPNIETDFKNSKTRREYEKSLEKIQKKLMRLNKSKATKRVLTGIKSLKTCENCESTRMIEWGTYIDYPRCFEVRRMCGF